MASASYTIPLTSNTINHSCKLILPKSWQWSYKVAKNIFFNHPLHPLSLPVNAKFKTLVALILRMLLLTRSSAFLVRLAPRQKHYLPSRPVIQSIAIFELLIKRHIQRQMYWGFNFTFSFQMTVVIKLTRKKSAILLRIFFL